MKKLIAKIRRAYKLKQRRDYEARLNAEYNLRERNGSIYIITGERAIMRLDSNLTLKEAVKALNYCRESQKTYSAQWKNL